MDDTNNFIDYYPWHWTGSWLNTAAMHSQPTQDIWADLPLFYGYQCIWLRMQLFVIPIAYINGTGRTLSFFLYSFFKFNCISWDFLIPVFSSLSVLYIPLSFSSVLYQHFPLDHNIYRRLGLALVHWYSEQTSEHKISGTSPPRIFSISNIFTADCKLFIRKLLSTLVNKRT